MSIHGDFGLCDTIFSGFYLKESFEYFHENSKIKIKICAITLSISWSFSNIIDIFVTDPYPFGGYNGQPLLSHFPGYAVPANEASIYGLCLPGVGILDDGTAFCFEL